ncbi:MAG: RidA family protein [Alphaproteobacteria bacterium]|nr:RidA family protein [Alphaproteobacteria bacterium]MBU0799142.1 RidA family protein [Alphaproteobacteria bacterium]MBU0888829.1 RidA family protein [Alphaproteobacteria bacterium]MBU1813849.1 RidA family protein [Alphaproteobacteria bacterium]MBU2090235.1 RidA family protein [Alphaproteobacteria bacterium]
MSSPIFHMLAGAPAPVAPYSHAVEADGWVFVTGQLASGDDPTAPLPEGIEAETEKTMENLRFVLAGLGLGFENVVQARVFLTHFKEDYAAMNAVYARYFPGDARPARTCIGVTGLVCDARVEIDMIARRP